MQPQVDGEEGVEGEQPPPQPEERQAPLPGSGVGAATALDRLKSQRERHARQQPADDPSLVGRRHDPQR
jgi:hypothetical protein